MGEFAHVAIDGPVASGKTTVARALAQRLGYLYLDTGAMYRAVALLAIRAGANAADDAAIVALADAHPLDVRVDRAAPLGFRIAADGHEFGAELFGDDVNAVVSLVAALPGVRERLVARQRAIASGGPVVMAGRDIGTVVLPDAPIKVFLTASVESRVRRRLAELGARGTQVDANVLRAQIIERDRLDEGRAIAPLRAAAGAVMIDSSALSIEAVVDRIAGLLADRNAAARP
ncbi:MAG: (d)CMP kinase [Vulcanimicrobiaceae bacterium]